MPYGITKCPRCGSSLKFGGPYQTLDQHICYSERDHQNDPVKPEESHRISPKKAGDICRCGGNQDCRYCGGTGIIR